MILWDQFLVWIVILVSELRSTGSGRMMQIVDHLDASTKCKFTVVLIEIMIFPFSIPQNFVRYFHKIRKSIQIIFLALTPCFWHSTQVPLPENLTRSNKIWHNQDQLDRYNFYEQFGKTCDWMLGQIQTVW